MAKKRTKPRDSCSSSSSAVTVASENMISQAIAAAINSSADSQPALKLCRLCEAKEGPFLNIFDPGQSIRRKIEVLLPFRVTEQDNLPHKICFRCSAKVEEFNDFVVKCVAAQDNLHKAIGKGSSFITKYRIRQKWEQKLKESKLSNDDICNTVVQQAMKNFTGNLNGPFSIKGDISVPIKSENKKVETEKVKIAPKTTATQKIDNEPKVQPLRVKVPGPKSKTILAPSVLDSVNKTSNSSVKEDKKVSSKNDSAKAENKTTVGFKLEENVSTEVKKPFNILDHISTIKVNGVGLLIQCHLCNRNFVNKDTVMTHSCAKNGVPKIDNFTKSIGMVNKALVKIPTTVKYINSISNNEVPKQSQEEGKSNVNKTSEITKPKPKIGPASKVKKLNTEVPKVGMKVTPREPTPPPPPAPKIPASAPAIELPSIPGLKSKFRLIPGPNNTFTLIEDSSSTRKDNESKSKRKSSISEESLEANQPSKKKCKGKCKKSSHVNELADRLDIVDLGEEEPPPQPYPVGLIKARSPQEHSLPKPFTTPAMKKQSYQVLQTGNPSKLLISAKPQAHRKPGPKSKSKLNNSENNQIQFTSLEPPANNDKDNFFTFINVDPLLEPSYVLPTNNIQESQVTTSQDTACSSSKDTYACNMCPEKFSREKKLLTHMQAHFDKLDQCEKIPSSRRKSGRKT